MFRLLRWTPSSSLLLFFCDSFIVMVSFYIGLWSSWVDLKFSSSQLIHFVPHGVFLAGTISMCMFMFGLYGRDCMVGGLFMFLRASASFIVAILILSLSFYAFPGSIIWRGVLIISLPAAFAVIILYRVVSRRAL